MINREIHIFFTAIMFYTRIPCPDWVGHNREYISKSTRYLPVIGWIVGAAYAGAVILLLQLFSPTVSLVAGLVFSILLTGAFHEDGFADVCDGFGGGWTREKILSIMKDSRIGTFGVTGLVLIFALKVSVTYDLLLSINNNLILLLIIVSSHALSRMMAVMVIFVQRYARHEDEESKAKPVESGISFLHFSIALVFSLVPLVLLICQTTTLVHLVVTLPLILTTWCLMHYFKKWIGGYTGDCLGAVQQVNEVVFLLSFWVIWNVT